MAGELDVDLVEIAATASPPVCRLMDYGKFKYQEQKKAAEAKAKQKVIDVKEVKFRPGTDDGDYNIKMRNIKRFLDEGDKCKITLRFRGREITHQELGMALLQRIRDELADLIVVEQFPKLEGRQMIMMIAPGRKKIGWRSQTRCPGGGSNRSPGLKAAQQQGDSGPNKSALGAQRPPSANQEHSNAQNEDQEQREKAFSRPSRWFRQARTSLQASHSDQEDHQEQTPSAWCRGCA